MVTAATFQNTPGVIERDDLEKLGEDFFELAESQLAAMPAERRQTVIASIHATAESLREGQ